MSRRIATTIGICPKRVAEYKDLHDNIWPEMIQVIKQSHITNHSIHLHGFPDGKYYLFSCFEYTGEDFEKDIAELNANPKTKEWLACCELCQLPLDNRAPGELVVGDGGRVFLA